jgi:hypothetical protein
VRGFIFRLTVEEQIGQKDKAGTEEVLPKLVASPCTRDGVVGFGQKNDEASQT